MQSDVQTPSADPADVPADAAVATRSRHTKAALAALFLCLAGPTLFLLLLDVPWIRSTALPGFVLLPIGFLLGVRAAVGDGRRWLRIAAVFEFLLLAGFVFGMTVLTRVPSAESFARLRVAPDFTLPDHQGRPFHLDQAVASRPVLIVFYRGFW